LLPQASLNITSAPILGITDAQVTMNRVEINENFDFTVSSCAACFRNWSIPLRLRNSQPLFLSSLRGKFLYFSGLSSPSQRVVSKEVAEIL
jgi:hypothetical protein